MQASGAALGGLGWWPPWPALLSPHTHLAERHSFCGTPDCLKCIACKQPPHLYLLDASLVPLAAGPDHQDLNSATGS